MITKPKLLVTSQLLEEMAKPSEDEFTLIRFEGAKDRDALLRQQGAGIEAVLAWGTERFDAAQFDLLPDLKLISVAAAGMAGIDLDEAKARGVAVTNAGDLNSGDVAEFAVTLMLAHRREVVAMDRWVREDRWSHGRPAKTHSVSRQRVGIVGLGNSGRAIGERIAPFGCEIAWWGPRAKPDARWRRIETLMELADWATTLFVAVAGNEDTRGLIDEAVLAALGSEGLVVNITRGFVIDQDTTIAMLRDGRLGGAALDVFDDEPIAGSRWADVPNLLMAPHVAGGTEEAFAAVMAGAIDSVRRHVGGRALERRVV